VAPAKTLPGNSNKFRQVVIQVQSGLTADGYYAGALTGVVDADTRAALSQMQQDNNLKVTGTITTEVLDAFGIVLLRSDIGRTHDERDRSFFFGRIGQETRSREQATTDSHLKPPVQNGLMYVF